MPSVSKAQQRFMGLVHAYKKGEVPASKVSQAVKDAAKSMKKKSTKDFASTKHDDLPDKVREYLMSENPAASAAAAMAMMQLQNPDTGKKVSAITPLRNKDHKLHKKSKGIFQRLKDKFMKKNESVNEISAVAFQGLKDSKGQMWDLFWREKPPYVIPFNARGPKTKVKDITDTKLKKTVLKVLKNFKNESVNEKVIKVSKKDDIPGNPMKMKGEEKIKKLTYSGSVGMDKPGSYEIKGNKLNVNNIRPRDKGFFVRHFTMGTGFRKANLYYDGVHWQGGKKF